jgi:hypothetical protein
MPRSYVIIMIKMGIASFKSKSDCGWLQHLSLLSHNLSALSRLLEESSFATTFQWCLFYILYIFAATCFGPCWPSSGGIHNYFRKFLHSQQIRCFVSVSISVLVSI